MLRMTTGGEGAEQLRSPLPIRELKKEHPETGRSIVVTNESVRRVTDDDIELIPAIEFLKELWSQGLSC